MKGTPTSFWGKLARDASGSVTEWHPLPAHSADVAACAEALLERTLFRRRLAALAGRDDLDEVDVARLAALAALHDLGKFNHGFQRKGDPDPRDTAGHVAEVLALFGSGGADEERLFDQFPVAELQSWCEGEFDGAFQLLTAAVSHHGRPVRWGAIAPDASLWQIERARDPFAGIAALAASARAWFPAAFTAARGGLPDGPAFQHGFAGLVMLADWLGSDRRFFPFADDLGDRMPFARERARAAVRAFGLDARAARASLGEGLPGFDRVSAHLPRAAQATTLALGCPPDGGLTLLESETGSGKTEAALGRFVQLLHAGLVDGMVFALPTRAAATQLHARVGQAIARAFPDEASRPPLVLAVPGYLQSDDDHGRRLPGFEVLWNDDFRDRVRHRGWADEGPKRYLAGAIVVGTIDQVLLSALRVGHAPLRATALLRHLLVVDEVHASDVYASRLLEEVLRFHLAAGGHALLLSAALGVEARQALERAALGDHAVAVADRSLAAALATPYPVVHHAARGEAPTRARVPSAGRSRTIHVALEVLADDARAVAARALEAARAGARVLVLRNTVTDAIATQLALEGLASRADAPLLLRVGAAAAPHHARFARDDRRRLDEAIERRFGKGAPPRRGAVAVATQTAQSLDLDADLLFTDLAPMDVLLQRFGRIHRHAEARDPDRPAGFAQARAIVMTSDSSLERSLGPSGEARGRHGVGTVYEDVLVLEATRRRLAQDGALAIPAQSRELVEGTTHSEALDALARELGGEAWPRHRARVSARRLAALDPGELGVIDRAERFGASAYVELELTDRAAARLGQSDRRARFATPPPGPFGGVVGELTVPGWLARGAPTDPGLVPSSARAAMGPRGAEVRFDFGPLRFVYDRLGLRRDDDTR